MDTEMVNMFPSTEDITVHKRARTRQEKEQLELIQLASNITNPQELADHVLELATKRYRQGSRVVRFSFEVPTVNFKEWALSNGHCSPDWDSLDRSRMRRELTRIAKEALKRRFKRGVFLNQLDACQLGERDTGFIVSISVINPS